MRSGLRTGLGLKLVCFFLAMLFFGYGTLNRRASAFQARPIDFNRDIRPILSDKCFACHGPDATTKKIKLRLDSEAAATADLGRGRRAVVPGDIENSQLVRRITAADEAMRMPPADSGHKLTDAEIRLLTEWIRQGAKWQQHWAFVPPVKPSLPQVQNKSWPKNEIDYFVLARLEREGLQPSPEADIALAEGFSWEAVPKILVASRATFAEEKVADDQYLIALVNPYEASNLPQFEFTEASMDALAQWVEERFLKANLRS